MNNQVLEAVQWLTNTGTIADLVRDHVAPAVASAMVAADADRKDMPRKYVSMGGVTYCLHGTSSINAFEALEKQRAAAVNVADEARRSIAELDATVEKLRACLTKVNGIRNSIIGAQTVNWSEHVYPLVAALNAAGFEGLAPEEARANVGTLLDRVKALQDEVEALRSGNRSWSSDSPTEAGWWLWRETMWGTPSCLSLAVRYDGSLKIQTRGAHRMLAEDLPKVGWWSRV